MVDRLQIRRNGAFIVSVGLIVTVLGCDAVQADSRSAALAAPAASTQPAPSTQPVEAAITLNDVNGKAVQPLTFAAGQRGVVLLFVAAECPICNAYAGEINRLDRSTSAQGIQFYLIDVDADLSVADIAKHAREYGLTPPVLLDSTGVLAKKFSATTTPEAILIDPNDVILYRGRIDDLYTSLGQRRYEATTHDLKNALDAVIAGRPVPVAVTKPVGCSID